MANTKISEYSSTPGNNTDIDGINIAEGCAPSGINNAIRELMSQLKDFQAGTAGDSFNGPHNGTVGATTPASGAFTTLSTTGNTTLGNDSGDVIQVNGASTFTNVNPILSAGTANGVAYLNGSKVLTTGSALVFDGANLGIGTNTLLTKFTVQDTERLEFAGISGAMYSQALNAARTATVESRAYASFMSWWTGASGSQSEQMRLTSTGLGIGTSSPGYQGSKLTSAVSGSGTALYLSSNGSGTVNLVAGTYGDIWTNGAPATIQFIDNGNFSAHIAFRTKNSGAAANADEERARIDSSGNLLVGRTTVPVQNTAGAAIQSTGLIITESSQTQGGLWVNRITSDGTAINFTRQNVAVGSISVTGSTTAYNISSDYRLKNTIAPMTGALAKVAALKPCTYKWNADGSDGEGFIAHELAEVVPQCVTGEKDAVETYTDEEGIEQTRPKYQGIDTSFLTATITAALQELHEIVKSQATEIAELKARLQ